MEFTRTLYRVPADAKRVVVRETEGRRRRERERERERKKVAHAHRGISVATW